MRITVHTFLTLDGVMQAPGGAEEDPQGGFSRGGWMVPFVDQDFNEIAASWFRADRRGAARPHDLRDDEAVLVDGHRSDNAAARVLNHGRKYVVSTTLRRADWGDTTILRSLDDVRALKVQDGGELQVHGSATAGPGAARRGADRRVPAADVPGHRRRRQATARRCGAAPAATRS